LARRVGSIPARWGQPAHERGESLDELHVDLRIRKRISVVAPFTLERVADVTLRVQHAPHEVRNISEKGFDAKARYAVFRQRPLPLGAGGVTPPAGGTNGRVGNPLDQAEPVQWWGNAAPDVRRRCWRGAARQRVLTIHHDLP